ncbi:MAG: hypothetical protein WDM81_00795 [Rhizomicrobium sp.]
MRSQTQAANQLARLSTFDRNSVDGEDRQSYDVVIFGLRNAVTTDARYAYGGGGAGSPYLINQMNGLYSAIPPSSTRPHDRDQGRRRRLSRAPGAVRAPPRRGGAGRAPRRGAGRGAARFLLDGTLKQMTALRSQPATARR